MFQDQTQDATLKDTIEEERKREQVENTKTEGENSLESQQQSQPQEKATPGLKQAEQSPIQPPPASEEPTAQTRKREAEASAPEAQTVPEPQVASDSQRVKELLQKAREKIVARRQKKLEKILVALSEKGKLFNRQIRNLLRVSDATATRYMQALEKEGKIRQVGTKRGSYYELFR